MLIVFLIDLPAPLTPGVVRNLGSVALPPGDEGRFDVEGARSPLFGTLGVEVDLKSDIAGIPPVLLRVLDVGNAGRAVVGGP
jgi:hypothetical protein